MLVSYVQGAELGDLQITWQDENGEVIDFSSGWSFSLKLGKKNGAAVVTKTTGITGAAAAPNVVVEWATTGELNTAAVKSYDAQLTATRAGDGKQRIMQFTLRIIGPVT